MKFGLLSLLFVLSLFSSSARAEVSGVRTLTTHLANGLELETTAFVAESEEDRQNIDARITEILRADLQANPNLKIRFEEVREGAGRNPSSKVEKTEESATAARDSLRKLAKGRTIKRSFLGSDLLGELRQKFKDWYQPRKYRVTYALTRGLVNTGVITWSYTASGLPLSVALPAATFSGLVLSGGFQYFNAEVQTFVTKTFHEAMPSKALARVDRLVEPLARQFVLEFAYTAAIKLSLALLGHPPDGSSMDIFVNTVKLAASGFMAQAFLDSANTRYTKWKLSETKDERSQFKIQRRSDLITMGISALSVAATVGKLSGMPIADTTFIAMTAAGIISYVKVLHSEWTCGTLLGPDAE
ncbi:MAG: hypothetical protein H7301_01795 [Cryobacterium sp.]|nr:hypothetical protein [Oligoflexia bacterium]